jgi:hypothetical protein
MGATTRVDAHLAVGSSSQEVTVQDDSNALQAERSDIRDYRE